MHEKCTIRKAAFFGIIGSIEFPPIVVSGRKTATSIADMHRHDVVKDGVKETKLTAIEEKAIKVILRKPKISSVELSKSLKVTQRQTQRIMAALKKKAGLKRRGGRRFGEWYFA